MSPNTSPWHQIPRDELHQQDHRDGCLTCSVVETDPYRRGVEAAEDINKERKP